METLHEKYGTIEETLAALREQLGYGQLEQQRDVSAPQQAIGKLEQESSPAAELAEERYDDLAAPRESPDEGREEGAEEAAGDREWEEFKRTQSLNLRRQLSARRTTDLVGDPVGEISPARTDSAGGETLSSPTEGDFEAVAAPIEMKDACPALCGRLLEDGSWCKEQCAHPAGHGGAPPL